MMHFDYVLKFIVIGDTGVGKSCLVLQFIENHTRNQHDLTIGVQFGHKKLLIEEKQIKLQIWDTAGQQNFRSITRSFYRGAIGALLVYDITRRSSFQNLKDWLEEVRTNGNPYMQILLVGNKNDKEPQRTVTFQQGCILAKEFHLDFMEVNARDYNKVEAAFKKVAARVIQKVDSGEIPIDNSAGVGIGKKQGTRLQTLNDQFDIYYCC